MEKLYDVWFSSLDIPNQTKLELLEKYSTKEIWELEFKEFIEQEIKEQDIVKILNARSLEEEKRKLEYMEKKNIQLICIKDEIYPRKLHNIHNKPAFLYVRGNAEILDEDSVGIVGCRMASHNGQTIARILGRELANRNINIISGLALGIDKYAHLGALDSEIGKTVAVLGCGVANEDIYPYQNYKVFERILETGGAVVSEYGLGSKPEKSHFPERNRILSGLSDKVIVVEAKKRSGSLITANWALEQGKDVFAVPGNILAKNSVGTNNLIKEGAYLFSNIEDIFCEKC